MPTLTPKQFAAHLRQIPARAGAAIIAAEQQTVQEGMSAAYQLSSGRNSLAGHPYSAARPNPAYNPAIINVQSGRFRAAWKSTGPVSIGGRVVSKIINDSPEAKYMSGTKRMVARPIATAIRAAVEPDRQKRLARIRAAVLRSILP
jgi:hypothetical protein